MTKPLDVDTLRKYACSNGDCRSQGSSVCPVCSTDGHLWLKAPDRFHGRTVLHTLLRCPSCSLVWLKNPPPPSEIACHYGFDYDRTIASAARDPRHWSGHRDLVLRYKRAGALLDLGCGTGGFLGSMKSGAWELYGIEMSPRAADRARAETSARIFVGDILDAPFQPDSFDAITSFHVLEHLYRPGEVLAKISDWLKPGGMFYTMLPNINSAGARIFRSYWYALELPRHLYHFSPASLRLLAASAGLDELQLTTHRHLFIESSLHYLLDGAFRRFGFPRTPLAKSTPANVPWRVFRKALRLTVWPLFTACTSLAGDGETIHAIFVKPDRRSESAPG